MRLVLVAAAVYNVGWGAWVVWDPDALFRLAGIAAPRYPQLWQCVGMVVGVYGIGYAVAAAAPLRHWPIVLVGLLGKILGPIGFAAAAWRGELPWSWGWTLLTNDVVWWLPFALILAAVPRRSGRGRLSEGPRPSVSLALRMARCQNGESLRSLSRRQPRLVVCLRHLGCSFCRETLADLCRMRREIEEAGAGIVLVHPAADDERAAALFGEYGLGDVPRIADPGRVLYRALGLARGSLLQVLGPRVVGRAGAAALRGHRPGRKGGDIWQMPGSFLIDDGRVVEAYRHGDVAERPDYRSIVRRATGRASAAARSSSGSRP